MLLAEFTVTYCMVVYFRISPRHFLISNQRIFYADFKMQLVFGDRTYLLSYVLEKIIYKLDHKIRNESIRLCDGHSAFYGLSIAFFITLKLSETAKCRLHF